MVVTSSLILRGAVQRARAVSTKALVASTTRLGSSTCSSAKPAARIAQHRLFTSAQPSSAAEVDASTTPRNDPLVSKEDEHKEETKRGRLSDVSGSLSWMS